MLLPSVLKGARSFNIDMTLRRLRAENLHNGVKAVQRSLVGWTEPDL